MVVVHASANGHWKFLEFLYMEIHGDYLRPTKEYSKLVIIVKDHEWW